MKFETCHYCYATAGSHRTSTVQTGVVPYSAPMPWNVPLMEKRACHVARFEMWNKSSNIVTKQRRGTVFHLISFGEEQEGQIWVTWKNSDTIFGIKQGLMFCLTCSRHQRARSYRQTLLFLVLFPSHRHQYLCLVIWQRFVSLLKPSGMICALPRQTVHFTARVRNTAQPRRKHTNP